MTRRTHWMVILMVLVLGLMALAACGDTPAATSTPVPATATALPPTATAKPATATPAPPTATAVPATATAIPATTAPASDIAAVPPPTGDAPIDLSDTTVSNLASSVQTGRVLKAQLVADDRAPADLLNAYVTQLEALNWTSVRVSGKLDITQLGNAYLSYLTKDGTDVVLRAQDTASFSIASSPIDQSDVAGATDLLKNRKTVLFIAAGKGFVQAIVNGITAVDPTATANPTSLNSDSSVTLSADSLKTLQKTFAISGQVTEAQIFAADTDQQTVLESALKTLTGGGWQILPLGGKQYYVNESGGAALLSHNGSDFAIFTAPMSQLDSNIAAFTADDQAKIRQMATGKKTLYFGIVGTGIATDLQKQINAVASSTPTPGAETAPALDFKNETTALLSAETAKSVQKDFGTPGQISTVQVFGDNNDPQQLIKSTVKDLTAQGWTVLPIGGKDYVSSDTSIVSLLSRDGVDIAVTLFDAKNIDSTISNFSTADKAKVHQLVDGKKSMALLIAGKGFAQALATKLAPAP